MLFFKRSILIDVKIFFQTLFLKRWLDKEGYIYNLSFFKQKKINYPELINLIKIELKRFKENFSKDRDYLIYLTRFGTHGSYKIPNKVFVNINREPKEIAETIIHEIVHLRIEMKSIKKKISPDEKEKLVDEVVKDIIVVHDKTPHTPDEIHK